MKNLTEFEVKEYNIQNDHMSTQDNNTVEEE